MLSDYQPGELYKTIVKDENWVSGLDNTTEEFKNKQGQVILKRTYSQGVSHDTYYVYDDYGNLTYVLPQKFNLIEKNCRFYPRLGQEYCDEYKITQPKIWIGFAINTFTIIETV